MAQVKDPMTSSDEPTSRELRNDIRRTRAQMDVTVDAIEDKLTPGELFHEAWTLMRGGSGSGVNRFMRIARQHPMPAAIISLGLGWMVYESVGDDGRDVNGRHPGAARYTDNDAFGHHDQRDSPGSLRQGATSASRRVTDATNAAVDKAGDLAGQARDTVGDVADSARGMASDVAGSVRRQASDIGRQASDLRDQARDGVRAAGTGFRRTLEEQPLIIGAATLAAGLLVGLLLPSTPREDELMGTTRDLLVNEMKGLGQEALHKSQQVVSAAADTLKQGAEGQGFSADAVAEKVRAVGREVVETVKSEAQKQTLTPDSIADKLRDSGGKDEQEGRGKVA
jgi:uncharacterized protein DUF3618